MSREVRVKLLRLDNPTIEALQKMAPDGISQSSALRVLIAWHARYGDKNVRQMASELAADGTYVHLTLTAGRVYRS